MNSGFLEELARGKTLPTAFGLFLAGMVLLPIRENWREEPKDDFPLSYYPMFTAKRRKLTDVMYLVGLDGGSGGRRLLPHTLAGIGGLNQVRRQINRAAREGHAGELCELIAGAVAASPKPKFADIQTVMIVKGAYRLPRYFDGETGPYRERVVASCAVERGAG